MIFFFTRASLSSEEEFDIFFAALQDFNLPKFIPEDVPLFKSIMQDVFPNVIVDKDVHSQLEVVKKKKGADPFIEKTSVD